MRVLPRVAGTALLAALFVGVPGAYTAQAAVPAAHHHRHHSTVRTTTAPTPTTTAPTPTTAPPASPAAGSSAAEQVLALVNAERSKAGCGPVRLDSRLSAAATKHSADMAANNYFSHVSRNGATFVDRIEAEGYPRPRSENIAAGNATAAATMNQWMNSAGHRANILDCTAKDMGVGVGSNPNSTYRTYWTQDFGLG